MYTFFRAEFITNFAGICRPRSHWSNPPEILSTTKPEPGRLKTTQNLQSRLLSKQKGFMYIVIHTLFINYLFQLNRNLTNWKCNNCIKMETCDITGNLHNFDVQKIRKMIGKIRQIYTHLRRRRDAYGL